MIDYHNILSSKYVGAQWSLNGDTYDGLKWLDDTPKPTKAELDALWPQVQKEAKEKVRLLEAETAKKQADRESAMAKLSKLGLTEDEIASLIP